MTLAPLMPSIRTGATPRQASASPRASTLRVVRMTLLVVGLLAGVLAWISPRFAGVTTPIDAGPETTPDARTARPPIVATASSRPSPRVVEPETPASAPDAGPTTSPRGQPGRRGAALSLREHAQADAARNPPPAPGSVLCHMPPNTLLPLVGRMWITTDVGDFRTLSNPHRPCGRSIDLAVEQTPAGLLVNGLRFDGRSACLADFRPTVLELEDTPGRFYAAWILPEGGVIRACPSSQTLSSLSRAKRTPRQPSPRSPSDTGSPTPAATPPPWMPRSRSSSGDSNEEPAWP